MPSTISTIGYITEANTTTSINFDGTTIIKGIIACNRLNQNDPVFVNFIAFRSNDKEDNKGPIQLIEQNFVYVLHGKFVYVNIKDPNNENQRVLQINVMTAYKININTRHTPEQEIFVSFQYNVLSIPTIEHNNISFKSQVIEFNGKKRTEIPIICLSSIDDQRIFNNINKLLIKHS